MKSPKKAGGISLPSISDDDPPWKHGPVENPVDRFAHLPEPTRAWLESLREDDIDSLTEAARFYQSIRRTGRFTKWLIITVVAVFVATVQFGEAMLKFLAWLGRGGLR